MLHRVTHHVVVSVGQGRPCVSRRPGLRWISVGSVSEPPWRCPPAIMNIIIAGQARRTSDSNTVEEGAPRAIAPIATTTRAAPYQRMCGVFIGRPHSLRSGAGQAARTPGDAKSLRRASRIRLPVNDSERRRQTALPASHCDHGTLQSPFCDSSSGVPPVSRTSTMSPGWENS